MNAMILAAGFGTRLKPLTDNVPKALIPLAGKPLLQMQLDNLQRAGFLHIAVNAHHLAEQVESFLAQFPACAKIEFAFEPEILNTGGGIKNMLRFFPPTEPICVLNVDILCDINFCELMHYHQEKQADATLVIMPRESSRPLLFDEHRQFLGRGNNLAEEREKSFGFCGIQIIQPELFANWPEKIFYSIDTFIHAAQHGKRIFGFPLPAETYWRDLGRPEDLQAAEKDLKQGRF